MRKPVALDDQEFAEVERARQDGILAQLAGEAAGKSETAALSALVRLGLKAVNEQRQQSGYEAWANNMSNEDLAYRQALRTRRRGGSSD